MNGKGPLYRAVMDPDNIRIAFIKAARGKRHRPDVIAYAADLEFNLRILYEQLDAMRPDIGNYRFFQVWDPKKRMICAASFPERVLHHALMNICEPVLDRYAVFDSYACRKGKGLHHAVKRAQAYARKYRWYLKLDIRKYFDSIDHAVLVRQLERRFADKAVLDLFKRIFSTYCTAHGKGLPIGNLVSQHMANFYLGGFDHWVKEDQRVPGYIRYMDDFLIFGMERKYLKEVLKTVRTYLDESLRLSLKDPIQLNQCVLGIPFLGFRVFPNIIRLSQSSKKRFSRKFRLYEKKWQDHEWDMKDLVRHMEPLTGFTRLADADGFRRHIIQQFGVVP